MDSIGSNLMLSPSEEMCCNMIKPVEGERGSANYLQLLKTAMVLFCWK